MLFSFRKSSKTRETAVSQRSSEGLVDRVAHERFTSKSVEDCLGKIPGPNNLQHSSMYSLRGTQVQQETSQYLPPSATSRRNVVWYRARSEIVRHDQRRRGADDRDLEAGTWPPSGLLIRSGVEQASEID